MEQDYLVTYRFFDNRARRLSIFAKQEGTKLHIYVITCSNKDSFKKARSRQIYLGRSGREENSRGYEFTIDTIEGENSKFTFIKWCKEKFFKAQQAEITYTTSILVRGEEKVETIVAPVHLKEIKLIENDRSGIQSTSN